MKTLAIIVLVLLASCVYAQTTYNVRTYNNTFDNQGNYVRTVTESTIDITPILPPPIAAGMTTEVLRTSPMPYYNPYMYPGYGYPYYAPAVGHIPRVNKSDATIIGVGCLVLMVVGLAAM